LILNQVLGLGLGLDTRVLGLVLVLAAWILGLGLGLDTPGLGLGLGLAISCLGLGLGLEPQVLVNITVNIYVVSLEHLCSLFLCC